jgi:hypothetical protein
MTAAELNAGLRAIERKVEEDHQVSKKGEGWKQEGRWWIEG